ncbi:hypothetical protein [Delftia sp. GW456-R20]|uniref:hypothetical protein n=1 Tax=Delftia sp. GW456-R20 TaxID=1827145 RepID=UPI0012E7B15D|nr:hypothetical protein [Delftia sp. GW456-R20]
MGIWLYSVLAAGATAIGITFSFLSSPIIERPASNVLQQEAGSQARITFEFLVADYIKSNPNFTGVLTIADLRTIGASRSSLLNGAFSHEWSAKIIPGSAPEFCTPVPNRNWPALIKLGAKLESLTCSIH